jgi:hypothetical protein
MSKTFESEGTGTEVVKREFITEIDRKRGGGLFNPKNFETNRTSEKKEKTVCALSPFTQYLIVFFRIHGYDNEPSDSATVSQFHRFTFCAEILVITSSWLFGTTG